MKNLYARSLVLIAILFALSTLTSSVPTGKVAIKFPYKKQGLTERQAAAHLLNRFTYGARPGEIDEVVKMGLENWFAKQLQADFKDPALDEKLLEYDALKLSNQEIVNKFPKNAQLLRMAIKDGVIKEDEANVNRAAYRDKLTDYLKQKGLRPQIELNRQLINQKILRAAYTNNQMQEILTDFWFNHFNVSVGKNQCSEFVLSYERDVIRPNVTGKFGNILLATAKSPAMLLYLDNSSSSGVNEDVMKPQIGRNAARKPLNGNKLPSPVQANRKAGLNENYAREVMELHTLGVDGGYTQADVTQAAKVLTGWTIYPGLNSYNGNARNALDRLGSVNMQNLGFVHDGDFLFAANRHEGGVKIVMGKKFDQNEGYQEGVELLSMLAEHPSTAKFISTKLAVRFVNDRPSASLIEKMTSTFLSSKGDISKVIYAMVSSPEFWDSDALREKTKSPFELAISSVRSMNAEISAPYPLYTWINKMGQKMYGYDAPTGFPDNGQFWINTGSLLNRMNFGLALASGRIPGVEVDLKELNKNREPESAEAALLTYARLLLPERDLNATFDRLTPMVKDPELSTKISKAAEKNMSQAQQMDADNEMQEGQQVLPKRSQQQMDKQSNSMLAQVVGVIIGSPEFQRK